MHKGFRASLFVLLSVFALASTGCERFLRNAVLDGVSELVSETTADLLSTFIPIAGDGDDDDG